MQDGALARRCFEKDQILSNKEQEFESAGSAFKGIKSPEIKPKKYEIPLLSDAGLNKQLVQNKKLIKHPFYSLPEEQITIQHGEYDTDITALDIDEKHSLARLNFDPCWYESRRNR